MNRHDFALKKRKDQPGSSWFFDLPKDFVHSCQEEDVGVNNWRALDSAGRSTYMPPPSSIEKMEE